MTRRDWLAGGSLSSGADLQRARIPLAVGVTGHRDIRPGDLPWLRERVRSALEELRALLPHTPLVILSPLAEGADRIVAEVGLETGAELIVPLPMDQAEYERDFRNADSVQAFRVLLDRAVRVLRVPASSGPERHARYRDASRWVVHNASVLLALWDGEPSRRPADTAEVVRTVLEGPHSAAFDRPARFLDPADFAPVLHLVTPSSGSDGSAGEPGALRWLYPGGRETAYRQGLLLLERYNAEFSDSGRVIDSEEAKRSIRFLALGEGVERAAEAAVLRYAAADVLALRYGGRRRSSLLALTGSGLVAAASWILYDDVPLPPGWAASLLFVYHVVLGGAFLFHRHAARRGWVERHLDYRALAEGLRVLIAWRRAGIAEDVADHYLLEQHAATGWIRLAVRITDLQSRWPADAGDLGLVRERWVEEQRAYFERSAGRDSGRLHRSGRLVLACLTTAVAASLALLALALLGGEAVVLEAALIGVVATGFGAAAGIEGYTEKTAAREQSRRYHGMRDVFARASGRQQELLRAGRTEEARELVFELGREALLENALWLLHHRSRPWEAPRGG